MPKLGQESACLTMPKHETEHETKYGLVVSALRHTQWGLKAWVQSYTKTYSSPSQIWKLVFDPSSHRPEAPELQVPTVCCVRISDSWHGLSY